MENMECSSLLVSVLDVQHAHGYPRSTTVSRAPSLEKKGLLCMANKKKKNKTMNS